MSLSYQVNHKELKRQIEVLKGHRNNNLGGSKQIDSNPENLEKSRRIYER